MNTNPPFDPPYKTLTTTESGTYAIETLADGSTRDLGKVETGDFNASIASASSFNEGRSKASPVKTTSFGNSKAAVYLNVPFADKDKAKAKGARWDATKKKWYAPHGVDLNGFKAWLPESAE